MTKAKKQPTFEKNLEQLEATVAALEAHVARVERLIQILDTDALDQLREIVNRITTTELRVSGKFV